jgi:anti-sigma-K factor RskA
VSDHGFDDSIAAYVLGALPADERAELEEHLRTCEDCRGAVAELRTVTDALAASAPPVAAPPAVRERVMATVRAEAAVLSAAPPAADAPAARRALRLGRLRLRPAWALAGAAAVAVAVVLVIVLGGGGGAPVTRSPAQVTAAAGPHARAFLLHQSGRVRLEVRHMTGPGAGRVYQVWLQRAPTLPPRPTTALFTVGRNGSATVDLPAAARSARVMLVSSEPAGGSRTGVPSRKPVLQAML